MIVEKLIVQENGEEILAHANHPFPHSSCYVEPEHLPGGVIPWHWHADVEVMYILQGNMELRTNVGTYTLGAGEGVFINTNVLHFQKPCPGAKAITLNQVFDAGLISGSYGSVFAQKYVEPILSCHQLDVMVFRQSDVQQRRILEYIKQAQDASDAQDFGYELLVRNNLSSMWLLLCREASALLEAKKAVKPVGEDRLKRMMRFIQSHYSEKLSLHDIACAANISEREALRTFRTNLHITPFSYLMEYRLRMATIQLAQSSLPASQIAYDCGFSTPSYFGKEFRRAMGCTPSEYRKKEKKGN